MSYYEARTYAPILPNGKAYRFYFIQEVKSFITRPSVGMEMKGQGFKWKSMGFLRHATAYGVRRDVDQPFLVILAEL